MSTKVFISWSGELSKRIAEEIRNWLPGVLQYVKPYFTPDDIEKGAKWNSEIAKELETSTIGIICLTRDNLEEPWILFESGALSKSIEKSHVCTILFNLEPAELKGPLTSFQSTKFEKGDFRKLIGTINGIATETKLESDVLDRVFEMWWPRLEEKIKKLIESNKGNEKEPRRTDRDILEEVLALNRMNARRAVSRSPSIHPGAVNDLLEIIDKLILLLEPNQLETGIALIEELDRPIEYICGLTGNEALYKKHLEIISKKVISLKRSHRTDREIDIPDLGDKEK